MVKAHVYFILTMRVSERASMASVLGMLESRRIEVLHFDEQLRTVVVRAHARELPFVKRLVESYASTAAFEFKASVSAPGHVLDELLKSKGRCSPSRPGLCMLPCSQGLLLVELKGRKLVLKYCRRTLIPPDPSAVPPSLCMFQEVGDELLKLLEGALQCFNEVTDEIGKLLRRG